MPTKIRWVLYAILCGFIAFTLLDDEGAGNPSDPRVVQPIAPRANSAVTPSRDVGTSSGPDLNLDALAGRLGQKGMNDLFAGPRVETPPPRVQATRSPPPAQPSAPPNPFTYLGMWIEGGKTQIFLANGNDNYVVQPGDLIDELYELEPLDAKIEPFLAETVAVIHRPTGTRQLIQMRANASDGGAAGRLNGRGDDVGDVRYEGEELN